MLLKRKRSEEGKRRDIFGGGDIKPVRVGYINAEGGGRRIRMMMTATDAGGFDGLGEEMRSLDFWRNGQFPLLLSHEAGKCYSHFNFLWNLDYLVSTHLDSHLS